MNAIVLHAEHLTRRFGALVAVDDLSLDVRQGEVFGLLGPNGSGKTTAIRMLTGLLKPDAGRVTLHGQPVRAGDRALTCRLGVCPQAVVVWKKLTCLEQLEFLGEMYGLKRLTARQRATKLLEQLGLLAKANVLARNLSGGMQRRLNLAAALVHDPEVVVLDEPEAGLDPQSRVLVRDFIRRMAREKTVIFTTHNLDEAERIVDRVAIVDQGRLVALDTPAALTQSVTDGDHLDIRVAASNGTALEAATVAFPGSLLAGDVLHLRLSGALEALPRVLETLKRTGLNAGEVRLRPTTLEDVFLALTGRSLRE